MAVKVIVLLMPGPVGFRMQHSNYVTLIVITPVVWGFTKETATDLLAWSSPSRRP